MASRLTRGGERRASLRVGPERTPWKPGARLRPGYDITVLNLSAGGALVESPARLQPGTRAELHLFGDGRHAVGGRIDRCRVTGLRPLRYEAALVFERPLEWTDPSTTPEQTTADG